MTGLVPTVSAEVWQLAAPAFTVAAGQSIVFPLLKATVPVGVPAPEVTVALRVTGLPYVGEPEAATVVTVGAPPPPIVRCWRQS